MTRVVVCLGAGGVGKTSIAAGLALRAAAAGRRALVMTADPARRLAAALGLGALGHEPRPVPGAPGLDAMMLDQKRAWDRLVASHSPSPEAARRLLSNRFYRELSGEFAGTHEYLAVEELCAAVAAGAHDLVVLDTPPADQALEFLDAPGRLRGLLDGRFLRRLFAPGRTLAGRGVRYLAGRAEQATGTAALADVVDFFEAARALFDSMSRRADALAALLRDRGTALVLVAAPDARGARRASAWLARLRDRDLAPAALVVNRILPPLVDGDPLAASALRAAVVEAGLPHAAWLADTLLARERLASAQAARVSALRAGGLRVATVPELGADVHDLAALAVVGGHLDAIG